jgi:hypothetical protein
LAPGSASDPGKALSMADYDPNIDYYELLQVDPRASTEVIKAAYRAILKELRAHPDLGGRTEDARLINEACRVLGDRELRQAYDGERLIVTAQRRDEPALEQVVVCPSCRRENPLPLGTDTRAALCSHCGAALSTASLAEPMRSAEPTDNAFGLPDDQYRVLCRESQIDVRAERVGVGEALRCRFCGNDWTARRPGKPLSACPVCQRADWHALRILKCRVCGHEWRSARLSKWAYRDHPRCPNCANTRWSNSCRSHPLRWFLGLLSR